MKAPVFDGIARELGEVSTRRSFFRLLGGAAAVGAGVALVAHEDMLGKSRDKGKSKTHGESRSHGRQAVAAQGRGGKKLTICFNNQTRTIKKSKLGNFPGATRGACDQQTAVCTSWVLSGGSDPNTPIQVDDDLQVMVNGVAVINDTDNKASSLTPARFTAKAGDSIGITAFDANPACRSLSPLWLHCATNPAQKRQLYAGKNDGCAPGRMPGTFVSEVFTI